MKSKTSMAHHNETKRSDWYLKSREKSQEAIYIWKRHKKKNRRTSGTFFDWLISQHWFNKELFLVAEDLITSTYFFFFLVFFLTEIFFYKSQWASTTWIKLEKFLWTWASNWTLNCHTRMENRMVSTFHYWNVHIQNTILNFSIALTNNIPFTMVTKSSESVILIINVSMHVGEGSTICNWFFKNNINSVHWFHKK